MNPSNTAALIIEIANFFFDFITLVTSHPLCDERTLFLRMPIGLL